MKGNFKREDELVLRSLSQDLQRQGGSYLWRHLLDLSMATDLLASGPQKEALCVQLTTVSGQYLTDKQKKWEATLRYWHIKRGLIVSYNPMGESVASRLAEVILSDSDALTAGSYNIITNF